MSMKSTKIKAQFEDSFIRTMFEFGLYNNFDECYSLEIEEAPYGYTGLIHLKPGLSFSSLEAVRVKVQESLRCIWIMEPVMFKSYAKVKIVTKPMDDSSPFFNPHVKPNELYMGVDFALKPILCDVNKYCMFLLAGATGSGKTRYIYQVLLAWILGCRVNEVEIYLSDIAKNEYNLFQYAKHVRAYAQELSELYEISLHINDKIERRKAAIGPLREAGIATNIEEYNKTQPRKLSYVYLIIDEFSIVIPDKTDSKDEKEMKEVILDILKRTSKIGRSLGVYILVGTQKTVRDELPSVIKNMAAVRISFKANDSISSQVIMGDDSAVGLCERYAVYSLNGGSKKDYFYSPYLSTEMLKALLEPHIDRKRSKLDLKSYSLKKKASNEPAKKKVLKDSSVFPKIDLAGGEEIDYR
ncbi:MAG: FtsK/SpoIIIE domain-containing protein [Clostridia bacterium]|nr:FtsK/SpoIIIE domain-containing protein [Clostridia bacterium]